MDYLSRLVQRWSYISTDIGGGARVSRRFRDRFLRRFARARLCDFPQGTKHSIWWREVCGVCFFEARRLLFCETKLKASVAATFFPPCCIFLFLKTKSHTKIIFSTTPVGGRHPLQMYCSNDVKIKHRSKTAVSVVAKKTTCETAIVDSNNLIICFPFENSSQ